ncbi:hypothetical protein ACJZ2D_016087 [Fusarium nematophilum]
MQSKPISGGVITPWIVLIVYKCMANRYARRWLKNPSHIVFFSKFCIKSTDFTTLAEAQTMQFVSSHTTIPVPKVYFAFEHKNGVYILMEKIRGQSLSIGWCQRSPESKARILGQLQSMIEQLRSLPPEKGTGISSITGGPIYDQRLPIKSVWGPFQTIRDFHRELRNGIKISDITDSGAAPGLKDLISFQEQEWETPVFTHGDLSSMNILARDDHVVGIIDWETAGWMPPYWEYTSAWHVNPQNRFWQEEIDKFLTPLPFELKMETIRRKYFGDF